MVIELIHIDCMQYMAGLDDNAFDLAIVDPPYGIARFKNGGSRVNANFSTAQDKNIGPISWDIKPPKEYFEELFRVSVEQIIWGANNFTLPQSEYFCVWDKKQTLDNFASAEYGMD